MHGDFNGKKEADVVPNEVVVAGVRKEVMRVFPFWKVFVELRAKYKRKPVLVSCDVRIVDREPCEKFAGVDVLWMQSDIVVSNGGKQPPDTNSKSKSDLTIQDRFTLGSMHFVHQKAHICGDDGSYNIQSVILLQQREQMQCVAGYMVHFAFIIYGMIQLVNMADCDELSKVVAPSSDSKVLIIGMGGNSMESGIRHIVGGSAHISIVDIEPAVVRTCQRNSLLHNNPNTHIHIKGAEEALEHCPDDCNFIFMDAFEPENGKMINSDTLVGRMHAKLAPGGILVINEHSMPNTDKLVQLLKLFGTYHIQYINVRGWNESIIVAVRHGDTKHTGCEQHTMKLAHSVMEKYHEEYPGWLPTYNWIERCRTQRIKKEEVLTVRRWIS
uniref:Spermidine synthase n=1 Tax=Trypanosoma congolense (strain IL3000) TaxID=1068625 RepID=G0UW50_TRYCI|nr:conserved hypothetical protein [Trypanosoma congolense IL3000]